MERVTKAIGSAVVSFVIMAPIFLLATSIFYKWDWYLTMILAVINFFEWLYFTLTIYFKDYKWWM